jgi:heterodisulfide reductase subunit B
VLDECLDGDPVAAQERSAFLTGLPLLAVTPEIEVLAEALIKSLQIPQKATLDAFHISISAVHGVEFLLTWNCKHIANPEHRSKIESVCRALGFEPPTICTPFDLLGTDSNE